MPTMFLNVCGINSLPSSADARDGGPPGRGQPHLLIRVRVVRMDMAVADIYFDDDKCFITCMRSLLACDDLWQSFLLICVVQSNFIVPSISALMLRICFLDVESMTGGMESIESDSGGCCAPTFCVPNILSYCAL